MGDSRFHLKATFEIYGESFDWNASLNWSAEPGEIDRRITEWLLECHDSAYGKYLDHVNKRYADIDRKQAEENERTTLRQLKMKYPND